jgi:hypothetical protein
VTCRPAILAAISAFPEPVVKQPGATTSKPRTATVTAPRHPTKLITLSKNKKRPHFSASIDQKNKAFKKYFRLKARLPAMF